MSEEASGYWIILLTLFGALILTAIPMGQTLAWWRPEWMLVVLMYWAIALPERIGVFTALIAGLVIDVLEGAVLGQNMLAFGVAVTLAKLMYQRLRMFSVLQQAAVVFVLTGIYELIRVWLLGLQGHPLSGFVFLYPAATSALFWPLLMPFLRAVRRGYSVS